MGRILMPNAVEGGKQQPHASLKQSSKQTRNRESRLTGERAAVTFQRKRARLLLIPSPMSNRILLVNRA